MAGENRETIITEEAFSKKYNKTLFRNMVSPFASVWEIDVRENTVSIMHTQYNPDYLGKKNDYDFAIHKFTDEKVVEKDRHLFQSIMTMDNLKQLKDEMSFDVSLLVNGEDSKRFRMTLTPEKNENDECDMIYLSSVDLENSLKEEANQLKKQNQELRQTLDLEEQFRLAYLTGAVMVYNVNLTKNTIEDEFYEVSDGDRYPVLEQLGLSDQCDLDEFVTRWSEKKVPEEDKGILRQRFNRAYLLGCYLRGQREVEWEFEYTIYNGCQIVMRKVAVLTLDKIKGEVIAIMCGRDISNLRAEDRMHKEELQRTKESVLREKAIKKGYIDRVENEIKIPLENALFDLQQAEEEENKGKRVEQYKKLSDILQNVTRMQQNLTEEFG